MNLKPPNSGGIAKAWAIGPAVYVSSPVSEMAPMAANGLKIRTDKC